MQHKTVYYSASSLCMFRMSTTPVIRCTQNCNYSPRYWSYFCAASSLQLGQASLAKFEGGVWLTPETCGVNLQNNK